MDPISLTIAGWIVQPAAQALFNVAQEYLLQRLGLKSSPSATSGVKPLLDEYLRSLMARLDEDRIAKLYGAFSNLKDAPRSVARHGLLVEALTSFQEVAQIPQKGMTGGRPNTELRCMAFIGMVAAYNLLHDRSELIAEKMVEAVHADADMAKKWLGENLVREIIARFPLPGIICPKCGFQNPAGSQFCNRDGYPLSSVQELPSHLSSRTSTLVLTRKAAPTYSIRTFQIILDDRQIGSIRNGKSCTLEIQPGRHTIFIRANLQQSSKPLTFDVAPGEQVTFLCQADSKGSFWANINLWKQ